MSPHIVGRPTLSDTQMVHRFCAGYGPEVPAGPHGAAYGVSISSVPGTGETKLRASQRDRRPDTRCFVVCTAAALSRGTMRRLTDVAVPRAAKHRPCTVAGTEPLCTTDLSLSLSLCFWFPLCLSSLCLPVCLSLSLSLSLAHACCHALKQLFPNKGPEFMFPFL